MSNNLLKRIGAGSKYLVIAAAVLVFTGWFINTPPGLLGKADAIGYAVCHRISERSFHIGSIQLPLCARCSGMYLGAVTRAGLPIDHRLETVKNPTMEHSCPPGCFRGSVRYRRVQFLSLPAETNFAGN